MRELFREIGLLLRECLRWTGQEILYAPREISRVNDQIVEDLKSPQERRDDFERLRDRQIRLERQERAQRSQEVNFQGQPRARVRFK